jgi:manganese/zinc/iron transport system substrate-binding protein
MNAPWIDRWMPTAAARTPLVAHALWILAVFALAGCDASGKAHDAPARRSGAAAAVRAVCTTGMVADLVRHVGGRHIEVVQLMGDGVDPHLYKVSTGDVAELSSADVVFYSGLHLEGKMSDVFARMAERKPTIAVTASIDPNRVLHLGSAADPHVWFDVALWSEGLASVQDALAAFDPAHAAEYRANSQAYRQELTALDRWCRERLATIPAARRILVTAHDAFSYFGRAYDLELKSIQGISTESEAGVREVNNLVEFIVDHGVKAVFVESSVSSRNMEALVEGCAARGHQVAIGGELFSDAMGPTGTPEETYVGMVRHNVETIVRALK